MKSRRRWAVAAASLTILSSVPVGAVAQGFGIRLERGEVGVDGRGRHLAQGMTPGATSSNLQQWLRLPVSGFLVHPRVLRYTAAVRPLFGQHTTSTVDQGTRDHALGLDMSATLFPTRRLGLAIQSTRSSGASRGDFGTHNEFENADFTTVLFLRNRYFPTTLTYSDRSTRDRWESLYVTSPVERDQRASRLRAEIRNKKLTAIVEQRSYRDLRGTSDHDALNGQARHRVGWGKGSSLVSIVNHQRREGTSEVRRTSWSERLSLLHTRSVSSSYAVSSQNWSRSGSSGRNLNYDATARYGPSRDFNASLSVTGQRFQSGVAGGLSRLRLAPAVRYGLVFAREARLSTSATLGIEDLTRELPSDALLDVIEESHRVEESRSFSLEQLRVEPESIEIWDEARTLLLQRDIDYRVVVTGPSLEIQILPGARVQVGEIVLVTYRYRSLATEDVGLFFLNYETTLRVRGLSLRHGRRQRSQEASGPSGTLEDPQDVDLWFGLGLSRRTRFGALALEASRRSRKAAEIEYTSDELRLDLALPAIGAVESRVRGSTAKTVAGELQTRTTSMGTSASWRAARRLRISGGVDGWLWERDDQSPESFLAGNVMVVWTFGQVNTVLTFDQIRRSNGRDHTENRWSVRLVRRF